MSSLSGKVIAITGASSGIGHALSHHLASLNATLALSDININALNELVSTLKSKGATVQGIRCDVSSSESVNAWIDGVVDRFGRLDGAVNVAGVNPVHKTGAKREGEEEGEEEGGGGGSSIFCDLIDVADDEWADVLAVNLTGVFYCLRAEVRAMLGRGANVGVDNISTTTSNINTNADSNTGTKPTITTTATATRAGADADADADTNNGDKGGNGSGSGSGSKGEGEGVSEKTRIKTKSIVNVASIAGLQGRAGLASYASSKHGVVGLTKTAAKELGKHGIRVNAICPGPVSTPMLDRLLKDGAGNVAGATTTASYKLLPLQRTGETDEIAKGICFLLGEEASFMTGVAMPVDGGAVC